MFRWRFPLRAPGIRYRRECPCYDRDPSLTDSQMLGGTGVPSSLMNPGGLALTPSSNGTYALFAAPANGTSIDSWMPRGLCFEPTTQAQVYLPITGSPTQQGPLPSLYSEPYEG